jgi:hypothetical protein
MGQINLERSVQTERLRYTDSQFWRLIERGFFCLMAMAFLYSSARNIWEGLITTDLSALRIIVSLVIASMAAWLIYGLIYLDKLSVIKGTSKEENKNLMYDLLTEMFADSKFFFMGDQLFGIRPWTTTKTGRDITLIFNDSYVLINITHKIRFGDMDSPFHVLTNQTDIREISQKFRRIRQGQKL